MVPMIHKMGVLPHNVRFGTGVTAAWHPCARVGLALTLLSVAGCVEVRGIRFVTPNVRYIAFGDSSTAGPSSQDYPEILGSLLGVEPETIANEGSGGETTEEGLKRLQILLEGEIYPNAKVLLYWEGGSDIREFIKDHDPFLLASPDAPDFPLSNDLSLRLSQIQVNIESVIAAGRNAGLRVYVGTYFFLREDVGDCDALPIPIIQPSQASNANAYIVRLNERIRSAVTNQEAVLVDVAAIDETLRQDQANYFDCNHLSEQGNAIVADLFRQALSAPTN